MHKGCTMSYQIYESMLHTNLINEYAVQLSAYNLFA